MRFYLENVCPELIINFEIPGRDKSWLSHRKSANLVRHEQSLPGEDLFTEFLERFQVIEILGGPPHCENGQVVFLSSMSIHIKPDLSKLGSDTPVPEHLMGENLPFKPTKMAGTYRYKRTTESLLSDRPSFEEEFFFPYAEGYQPKSFDDVVDSFNPVTFLSDNIHALIHFKVSLMEAGTHIRLLSYTDGRVELPFVMAS